MKDNYFSFKKKKLKREIEKWSHNEVCNIKRRMNDERKFYCDKKKNRNGKM